MLSIYTCLSSEITGTRPLALQSQSREAQRKCSRCKFECGLGWLGNDTTSQPQNDFSQTTVQRQEAKERKKYSDLLEILPGCKLSRSQRAERCAFDKNAFFGADPTWSYDAPGPGELPAHSQWAWEPGEEKENPGRSPATSKLLYRMHNK